MKNIKLLALLVALFSMNVQAGGGGAAIEELPMQEVYIPEVVEEVIQEPIVQEIVQPVVQETVQEPCNCEDWHRWSLELWVYECDVRSHVIDDSDLIDEPHVQFSMNGRVRYHFNKSRISDYYERTAAGESAHRYSQYRNSFNIFFGIESYTRYAKLQTATAGQFEEATGTHIDPMLGLGFHFRLFNRVLHSLDLAVYYSISNSLYSLTNNTISYTSEDVPGVYVALPTWFSLSDHFSLGFKVGAKKDFGEHLANVEGSDFLDIFFALGLRADF